MTVHSSVGVAVFVFVDEVKIDEEEDRVIVHENN